MKGFRFLISSGLLVKSCMISAPGAFAKGEYQLLPCRVVKRHK